MVNAAPLVEQWGYWAIFGTVVLGNLGFPVPEEGILLFAGYLVWTGRLELVPVIVLGVLAAVIGDNLGYWFGRHYGQAAIKRFGHKIFITDTRLEKARDMVNRYGSYGVFIARFVPGFRFMSGPVAGSAGLGFGRFFTVNVLGGLIYVPLSVGAGYFLGKSLGNIVSRVEAVIGKAEHLGLLLLVFAAAVIVMWRALGARKIAPGRPET